MEKCLINWTYYCKVRKAHVTEWLPGRVIEKYGNGRFHVKADNGMICEDAAPECVVIPGSVKSGIGARVRARYDYDGLSKRSTGTVLAVDDWSTQVLWDEQPFMPHSGEIGWCGSMHLEPE